MPPPDELDFDRAIDDSNKLVLLGSALKTGIFSAITTEKDIATIASELGANRRALYIVLEALCGMGYVEKKKEKYMIADRARPLFIEGGRDYPGGYLPHALNKLKAWLELPAIIRGEKMGRRKPENLSAFMNAMASRPDEIVNEIVSHCLKKKKDAKTVLDIGGGPGKYSRVFVNKGLKAVLFDMPETIDYVSREFGLSDIRNLERRCGDFTDDEFVKGFEERFDIVFMGNITHIYSEDENRALLLRAARLLKKGGMAAIEDFVRGRSPCAEMFAVNMLASTESGGTWTEAQYREWLKDAGFSSIDVLDLADKEKQLITAFLEK
ncbi:MAG: methyltransferase domain-containing protein [Euryarchaeota archaeon]|nr:methyltransferase domain-containing protein [Euryarchaeota archaeon]MBU4491065.1 methyltransferase domain-containing protein [Euryarchaeota archaeon]MCG2727414.1 methyltransferase domain-containing protein [Candidatus Methanoperedenaceae archaeon]